MFRIATTTSASNTADSDTQSFDTRNASLSYFQKTVCLRDWWLIMSEKDFEGKRLAVAGLTGQEKQAVRGFSSAPILKRHDKFTLETADEIYVLIDSLLNKDRTKANGFPAEVFNNFICGFPTNWEEYADKLLAEAFTNTDVSTPLVRDKLVTDSGTEGNADISEMHRTSDKTDLNSEEKGRHKPQDGVCNDPSLEDPKLRSSQVVSEMIIDGTIKYPDMDTNINPTRTSPKRRISSRLKNLSNPKNANDDEAKLNCISAAGIARSVGKMGIWDGISLSRGRTSNRCLSKRKSNLKDIPENVNPLNYEENKLRRKKYDNFKQDQMDRNITSQARKQSKKMDRAPRSCTSLCSANQIDDFQIAVRKKAIDVESASKSSVKSKRKLSYESPVTKGGTEKPSFVSPESSSFKRSRSGRLLLPTLEFWRNQLAIYDADRQVTGIQEGLQHPEPYRGRSKSEPQRKPRKLS